MPAAHVPILAKGARLAEFAANEVIFREQDAASHCYLVQEGRVVLESRMAGDDAILIQTVGGGEVPGWSWLFAPHLTHFQARALERTQTICLNGAQLLAACEMDRDFGYELIRRVSQLLIKRLQATRQQLLKLQSLEEGKA